MAKTALSTIGRSLMPALSVLKLAGRCCRRHTNTKTLWIDTESSAKKRNMLRLVSRATARVGAAKVARASALATRSVHVEASTSSIQTAIEENDVMLFTKTTCPFCARVKDLFDTLDIPYTAAELNELDNGAEIQDLLLKMTGQRTVPNVFIKGQHIGGCDETLSLHDQKKLLPLFEKN